jgi:hypothetical protein
MRRHKDCADKGPDNNGGDTPKEIESHCNGQCGTYGGDYLLKVERRTIEHIPHDERHGKAKDLFPVWFGANMHITTLVTGTLPVTIIKT